MRLKPLPEKKGETAKTEQKATQPKQQELIQQQKSAPKPAPAPQKPRVEPPMPTDNPFEDEENNDFDIF